MVAGYLPIQILNIRRYISRISVNFLFLWPRYLWYSFAPFLLNICPLETSDDTAYFGTPTRLNELMFF